MLVIKLWFLAGISPIPYYFFIPFDKLKRKGKLPFGKCVLFIKSILNNSQLNHQKIIRKYLFFISDAGENGIDL